MSYGVTTRETAVQAGMLGVSGAVKGEHIQPDVGRPRGGEGGESEGRWRSVTLTTLEATART